MSLKSIGYICATMVLGTALAAPVLALAEQYPAADFKPSVLYQNADLIGASGAAKATAAAAVHAPDPKYPAAYFNPTVIHSTVPVAPSTPEPHATDPKYPAAYFNPTVITPAK